jgi:3-methyl-2-oxobutanoate hydroxymethyltransferase
VDCDGQVLVLHDLLGFDPKFQPRFVRRFADGAELVNVGIGKYAAAVRAGKFPNPKESF